MEESAGLFQFEVPRPCRYLLSPGAGGPVVLALHGYGMSARTMLGLTRGVLGPRPTIAALEAPNTFFLTPDLTSPKIGYNWGTHETASFHVEVHHRMVMGLLEELRRKLGTDAGSAVLLGFSQSVGLNYRFAAAHPGAVRGVAGICGGVPKTWEDGEPDSVDAALLHISRSEDEYFPPEVSATFEERLRWRARDVEFHLLPGEHRFPSKAGPILEAWLDRVLGR
jgi:predicted esterase